jgi:hypothetical protein
MAVKAKLFTCLFLCGGLFTVQAEEGTGISSSFAVDTRWGFSEGAAVSGFFMVDTRLSGSASAGFSGLFTVDTLGAGVANAGVNGNVNATIGGALAGVYVQALQSGITRASTFTDNSGHFQLALAAGTYELRASKIGWLTGIRNALTISANQTVTQNFSLDYKPPATAIVATSYSTRLEFEIIFEWVISKRFIGPKQNDRRHDARLEKQS